MVDKFNNISSLYLACLIGGGQVGLPILIATFLFAKKVYRHPTLINFCITWVIYSVSYSMLCVHFTTFWSYLEFSMKLVESWKKWNTWSCVLYSVCYDSWGTSYVSWIHCVLALSDAPCSDLDSCLFFRSVVATLVVVIQVHIFTSIVGGITETILALVHFFGPWSNHPLRSQ